MPMLPEPGGRGLREIASYFLSTSPPPRIGLLRLGPNGLNQAGVAIAASLERAGKRVLLLRSNHKSGGTDPIVVREGGFREGPLADWKTCDERLGREERASDLLLLLLDPESPSLPRMLPVLNLLVLLLSGDTGDALRAYRSAKRVLVTRRDLPFGLFVAGEGEAASAVLERFLLGLRVFLGLRPLNFGSTTTHCAQEIINLQLGSPAEPYFRANS